LLSVNLRQDGNFVSVNPQPPAPPVNAPVSTEAPQPPPAGRNGLAIAGFILAILIAPIGFILSLIGLIQAARRGQKGKVLASLGLVISILIMAGVGLAVVALGKNVTTVADPGCVSGKQVILDNKVDATDAAGLKTQLQTVISGLNSAAAKAKHDNVRSAMTKLAGDYNELLQALNNGTQPAADLESRVDADAQAIDSLCTVGGAK
jgi:hypothetical protein